MCPNGTAVSSEEECRKAATTIQKQFDHAWNGPNDFPGCLIANDGRDKVYWNTSPSPSETANNPQYGAICIKNAKPGDFNLIYTNAFLVALASLNVILFTE